ncbi:putative small auxin-up RNA [Helianthus annuus]|uniref:Small auxin-up RNA n=1 Tax=Helianthus annuus TaxID=4232 RepID=A0A251UKG6_HELAN|nr:putative small auxin-up RNA [Helianthus annuus]KAJ0561681.1 putative small auxin-up RNA [Helianthus annuus]KAJ0568421.1 putative small auxin-up RNA [Helianthus annuus]KAJ0574745.1 putative small auxin-up RNA [Helianthus annuus]KAJ0739076.1 putative small auxin-up RNA [Helianthus annuus]
MAIRMPRIIQARKILRWSLSNGSRTPTYTDIPKGYFAIYVGEQEKKRHMVPVSLLSEPLFQDLLRGRVWVQPPNGRAQIPCSEDVFTDLASRLGAF